MIKIPCKVEPYDTLEVGQAPGHAGRILIEIVGDVAVVFGPGEARQLRDALEEYLAKEGES